MDTKWMILILIMIMAGGCAQQAPPQTDEASADTGVAMMEEEAMIEEGTMEDESMGMGEPTMMEGPGISTMDRTVPGTYITDGEGLALYYFTKDTIDTSVCTGGCLANWPVFYAGAVEPPPSLDMDDFRAITRDDGLMQSTYKGWPLYCYAKDTRSGDTSGEGVGGAWFLIRVPFYTIMIANKADPGDYLIGPDGMALYIFGSDSFEESTCTGGCLANWPVFYAGDIIVPSSMDEGDFGTITRDDGLMQSTYKGWPLYYYVADTVPGDTSGHGLGSWSLAQPGAAAASKPSTSMYGGY